MTLTVPDPDDRPRARRDPPRRHRAVDAPRPRRHLRQAARRGADLVPRGAGAAARDRLPAGPGLLGAHPLRRRDAGVSRDPDTFHSAPSINIGDIPPEIAEWLGSMINMDAPKHTKLRLIVNRGFTPRQVAQIDDNVREQAREIVDRVIDARRRVRLRERDRGRAPPADHLRHARHPALATSSASSSSRTRSSASATPSTCSRSKSSWARAWSCSSTASTLAQDRLDNPRDDITTTLMQAEVEDENGRHKLTTGRARLVLPAARRRRQRDDAQRDQPRHARAHRTPRPARDLDRRPRRRVRPPRSRRSCAGPRRSSTSAAPRSPTRWSAARRSRPARRS